MIQETTTPTTTAQRMMVIENELKKAGIGMTVEAVMTTTMMDDNVELPLHIKSDEIYDGVKYSDYVRVNTETLRVRLVQVYGGRGKKMVKKVMFPMELTAVLDRQTGVKLHVKTQKAEVLDLLMKELPKCVFEHFYEGVDPEELSSSSGDDKEEEEESGCKNGKRKYPFDVGDESECAYLVRNDYDDEEFVLQGWDMEDPFYS